MVGGAAWSGVRGECARRPDLAGARRAARRAAARVGARSERLGVRGAAVNVLLVRPSAGQITEHRVARLRRLPQRRTVHGVRLARLDGAVVWVANAHAHNRPAWAAEHDVASALGAVGAWAGVEPAVLLGDLNLSRDAARRVGEPLGFGVLASDRVDHVVASRGVGERGAARAVRPRAINEDALLSDHRLLSATLTLPS